MKRRGISVFAGLASAGALALTGLVGTQAVVGTGTTESFNYQMKENESSLTYCGDIGAIGYVSKCASLDEEARRGGYGQRNAFTYLKGYNGKVLLLTQDFLDGTVINGSYFPNMQDIYKAGNTAYQVNVYTQDGNKVTQAGFLLADKNHPIKIKDGVIYACNDHSFETYILSDDGKELVHKDYVDDTYWGYTNETNKEENRKDFTGGEKEYKKLWEEYDKASEIDFTIYQYEMGKNDSSLTRCGNDRANYPGAPTFYTDFDAVFQHTWNEHCVYAKVNIRDFDGDILAVTFLDDPRLVFFLTQKDGENLVTAGYLYTDGTHPVRIKDGVIYACNKNSFETYLITPDGKELVHKDYVNSDNWGYTNETSDQSKRVAYEGSFNDPKLWDAYNSASEINYDITAED